MTAKVSDYKSFIYTRDYSHDIPPQTTLFSRIASAALPFLGLHKPFRLPLSISMGTLRIWNSRNLLQTAIAVAALAGTIFQHRVGQLVTSFQDLFLDILALQKQTTWEEAAKSLIKIFNNLIYVTLLSVGGLELSILSLALHATVNLIASRDEFKSGRWIEGCANLLMAAVRLKETHGQYQQLKRNWEIEEAIRNYFVGELHEKWRFPSDHLPIGIEVDGTKIISWNVMNSMYMEWVKEKDSQGLNGSLITELDVVIDKSGLTQRDVVIADMVKTMMSKGHVVALQECSMPFLNYLQSQLPSNWELVKSFAEKRPDQDVVLYDKTHLTLDGSKTSQTAYPSFRNRPIQEVSFTNHLHIFNAHIPGDPTKPGREEFAQYVYDHHKEGQTTVAVGDYNFERGQMIDAFMKAGFTDFSLHSQHPTNIDPYSKESKAIDHAFVVGTEGSCDMPTSAILSEANLQETIDLLRNQ